MKMKKERVKGILVLVVMILAAAIVVAQPYGASGVAAVNTGRGNLSMGGAPPTIGAQAGNVTELQINGTVITRRWQGYYGNISGRITLDNAENWTMYDWSAGPTGFSPVGEIYAANNTITDWNDVICVNFTGDGTVAQDGINATNLDSLYNMGSTDGDGIDETFTGQNSITIGGTTLTLCPALNTFTQDTQQSTYFNETLLTENSTGTVIFATQVDQDTTGFDDNVWDFQMIVGENGDDDTALTSYYFYVELS